MRTLIAFVLMLLYSVCGAQAAEAKMEKQKTAVVVAAFGTTYDKGLSSLLKITEDIRAQAGDSPVRLAFTSNIIRKIWHGRLNDAAYRQAHKNVPEYLYSVKNVLGTLGDLQDEGYRTIVIQPTYIYAGEEFSDLRSYAEGLNGIKTMKDRWKPFETIVVGDPATGFYGYREDLKKFAVALKPDVEEAAKAGAALVYMGHGNENLSTGIYFELEHVMRELYPQIVTVVGTVEGHPDLNDAVNKLKAAKAKKVIIKPLMIVAGDHANNDMASDEDDSWKSVLARNGFSVTADITGLGENPLIRKIYVDNMLSAAKSAGIELK